MPAEDDKQELGQDLELSEDTVEDLETPSSADEQVKGGAKPIGTWSKAYTGSCDCSGA
jgi:hypothetical protein